jgi:hypothetical protein
VTSVDGVGNTNENAWVLFKWASPNGWATLSDKSPSIDGMTIALRYADRTVDDKGSVDYSAPDVEVEYKVYFFIQWKEQYNSTSWMQRLALTDSEKQAGVWIEGWGSNANEALADATLKYFYPGSSCTIDDTKEDQIIYSVDGEEGFYTYGTKSASYGWFLEYLGWSDTKKSDDGGDYGTWTYWSQYTYHPDAKSLDDPAQWGYNQTTFGMYDITKQRYFGLVLQTTVAETDGTDIQLPAPSTIPAGL